MHGKVADRLGDPTARLAGRLTLNPIPHLDPIGSVLVPLFLILTNAGILFGWAKPVPIDPFNLKNPRRDSALTALAGPGSNLLIAIIFSILVRFGILTSLFVPIVFLNVILGLFNLIPIPPLDGFKVVGGLLSDKHADEWYQLERYGFIFLIALILPLLPGGESMLSALLGPVVSFILSLLLPGSLGTGIL